MTQLSLPQPAIAGYLPASVADTVMIMNLRGIDFEAWKARLLIARFRHPRNFPITTIQLPAPHRHEPLDWQTVEIGAAAREQQVAAVVAELNPVATKPIPTLAELSEQFNIPPVFVEAEAEMPPSVSAFRKLPAEAVTVGDLLILSGVIWRVKNRRTSKTSVKITFTIHPVQGGRPESETFYPRNWIPVYKVAKGKTA